MTSVRNYKGLAFGVEPGLSGLEQNGNQVMLACNESKTTGVMKSKDGPDKTRNRTQLVYSTVGTGLLHKGTEAVGVTVCPGRVKLGHRS